VYTEVHNASTSPHSSSQFIDKSTIEIKRCGLLRQRLAELWWEQLLLDWHGWGPMQSIRCLRYVLWKNSKRHVRQESSCPSYNLNCLSLYFV
jgi:hypothetical protein